MFYLLISIFGQNPQENEKKWLWVVCASPPTMLALLASLANAECTRPSHYYSKGSNHGLLPPHTTAPPCLALLPSSVKLPRTAVNLLATCAVRSLAVGKVITIGSCQEKKLRARLQFFQRNFYNISARASPTERGIRASKNKILKNLVVFVKLHLQRGELNGESK